MNVMPPILIETRPSSGFEWLDRHAELAAWMHYLDFRDENTAIGEQSGSNLGARDVAALLAQTAPALRSVKLGWLGAGWLKHVERMPSWDQYPDNYTTDDRLFRACRSWQVDTGAVAAKVKDCLSILFSAEATKGLWVYFELEDEILLQSRTLNERMLDDAQCMRQIQVFGGMMVADATREETLAAMNWETWTDRAKAIRAPFIIAGRQLVAQTVSTLLRQHPRAWKGIPGFVMSNCARQQARDYNGHKLPGMETSVTKHVDMVYLHQPDGQVFHDGQTAFADVLGVLRGAKSESRALSVNLNATNLSAAEMAWRLQLATRAPAIIFADNPARTRDKIEQTLELMKELA